MMHLVAFIQIDIIILGVAALPRYEKTSGRLQKQSKGNKMLFIKEYRKKSLHGEIYQQSLPHCEVG